MGTLERIPRLLIAAASSGSGKTTIVGGVLAALRARGLQAAPYKVGPDYIDPGHHRRAGGGLAHNLDTWMMDAPTMTGLFARTARGADVALVEGIMGLHDGGGEGISSSAEIARLLGLPVVLVIDAHSMVQSAAAVALGFREYDRGVDLRGVILNRLNSASHRDTIAEALGHVGIPLLGALMKDEALTLTERRVGLAPSEGLDESGEDGHTGRVRAAVERSLDVEELLAIARSAPPLDAPSLSRPLPFARGVRVALARDEAFSFYYPESLEALEDRGAELVPFSPLRDAALPAGVQGMLLGGGFPEVFAYRLEANASMRRDVARAAWEGLPILAECGGMMYLCRSLTDFEGRAFQMAGVIPAVCRMNSRFQTVGYVEATALSDTVICPAGTVLRGHEFHFSSMEPLEDGASDSPLREFPYAFAAERAHTGATYKGGYARGDLLASYLHLNLLGSPGATDHFLERCLAFGTRQTE